MGATYKLKRKKADGTLEDVILQGVITDLGEQEDNALAEQAIINLLKPTSVQTGSYLYTYHTTCRNDAVMAICSKTETVINITYISSLNGTVKYSSYDIGREELQSECWRLMADRNPSFESVSIGEYNDQSQCNNQINAQGFYINLTNEFGNSYLSFNINDGVELVQYDGTSLVLNGGYFSVGDSDENSLIITPSAITHNDNEYQFPNKSGTLAVTEDIPSVGNGTITIKQAGTTKGTFTINQSGDTTIELGDAYVIQAHTTTDANYPLLFKLASGITTTGNTTNSTRYANNIYANPSTGTIYANDFVVDGKSIVGGGGGSNGIQRISEYGEFNLTSSTVGAYFKIAGSVAGATEFYVGEEAIVLNSNYDYFISVEGILKTHVSANSQAWKVMVIVQRIGSISPAYYAFHVSTTAAYGVYIGDDVGGSSYYGIFCE